MSVEEAIKTCYQQKTTNGFLYSIPSDFPAFQGHFDGYPLLPAVCQLSLCADAAGRLLARPVEVTAIKRAKFLHPVLPDCLVEILFTQRPDGSFSAELLSPQTGKKFSQFIVWFSENKK